MAPSAPSPIRQAQGPLVLAYGAATLAGQVLILREILVLAQGQELKLAVGLWCWLLWTGLGSLLGGWLAGRRSPDPGVLATLLAFLALLLPGTLILARACPTLAPQVIGQSLPPVPALVLFLVLLAPFCLVSGCFFPFATALRRTWKPLGATGRIYALEALGAALGVCLLQLFLVGKFAALALGLGVGLGVTLIAWVSAPPRAWAGHLILGGALLILGVALVFSQALENFSRKMQWPGREVITAKDSPYALLTATREAEQTSFFANRVWHFTHPDPYSADMAVHLGLLQHPRPQSVLLLGGGAAGLIPEVLKHKTITMINYVELDPDLVHLVQHLVAEAAALPARDPRVHLIFQDARRFLSRTAARYDVILMNLPEPGSAQLNRYYTREFFALAAQHLKPEGVFSFPLTGGEAGINPQRAGYLALAYHTLKQVFPEVLVFPGERVRFFASPTAGVMTQDPEVLAARLAHRGLSLRYVREYFILDDLSIARQKYVLQLLEQAPAEINTDLNPRSYFYDLILISAREGLPFNKVLLTLRRLPPVWPWAAAGLAGALALACLRRRTSGVYLAQVFTMGLGALALEVLVLVLCQIQLGLLYRELGLLVAAFMAGMGAGGTWGVRLAGRGRATPAWLAACQVGLAFLALFLVLALSALAASEYQPPDSLLQGVYLAILFSAGFAGGGVFSLASSLWQRHRPATAWRDGVFYAADLLGATLGSLGLSLLLLPVGGMLPALLFLVCLHLWAVALALI
uniref:Polyamine aminopropyltransferase n=1 Tax=Desulfobacca acetoxidans TaxID=60893 RepID=A0A7C3V4W6_9BACT